MGLVDGLMTRSRAVDPGSRTELAGCHPLTTMEGAESSAEAAALRGPRLVTAESQWIDIDGPVHYVDFGGPAGAPTMVMVHGLMGAHVNWLSLVPELNDEFRVIALDLVGHGLTTRAGRGTDVGDPGEAVRSFVRFWKRTLADSDFRAGCPAVAVVIDGRREFPEAAGTARAGRLATLFVAAIEGAIILCRASGDVGPLDDVAAELIWVLDAAPQASGAPPKAPGQQPATHN